MAKKPSINFLAEFAVVERREGYEWYRSWTTGLYNRYRVVTTEVWENRLAEGQAMPADFVNPGGKAVGVWRCEDRSISDPWGTPLNRTYRETWVHRSALIYV